MPQLVVLSRSELAKFIPDSASIRQFEDLFSVTNVTSDQTAVNAADIITLTSTVASKVDSTLTINTTSPLTGGGDLSANRTLSIPAASTTVNGYLTSIDWNTFNSKQAALGFTPVNKAGDTMTGPLIATTVKASTVAGFISSDGSTGFTGTVTTASLVGKTITIKDGIITGFA